VQLGQRVAGAGELGDALLDLNHVPGDQVGDVLARGLPAVADAQDAADLRQREPSGLGLADEGQPADRSGRVVAVAARRARRGGEEPGLLVKPDRLRGQARGGAEFTDQHGARLPLDLPAHWKP
jgi:hypothetical protein